MVCRWNRGHARRIVDIPSDALVLLCGGAASGKSHFAARNFRPTQVVSSDKCRALVADDEARQFASGRAFDLFYRIIEHRLALGRLPVADSTARSRDTRRTLRSIARRHGRPVVVMAFDVGLRTCLQHDALRGRRVGLPVIRAHRERFLEEFRRLENEGYCAVHRLRARGLSSAGVRIVRAKARNEPKPAEGRRPRAIC